MKRERYKLGELVYDFSLKAKDFEGFKKLEFFGVSNDRGIIPAKYASRDKIENYKIIEQGCFAYNPYRINVGSIAYVEKDVTGLISPAYVVFKANENLVIPYLLFKFLKSKEGLRQITFWGRGTVREALRFSDLSKLEIELPEIEEQKLLYKKIQKCESISRIIDGEIETQFSLLNSLREAIFTEAIQGHLTAQWRKEDPKQEPASELLQRIAAEKAQLIKEKKINKEKPLPPINKEEEPYALPEGWLWCRADEIVSFNGGVAKGKELKGNKVQTPYLRVANVQRGYLDLSVIKEIIVSESDYKKYQLQIDDLLMIEGGDPDKVGRCAIWRNEIPNCIHQNHIFRVRTYRLNELCIEFLELFFNSPVCQKYYEKSAKQTTNLASINKSQMRMTPIAIPSLSEQQAIVQKANMLIVYCDELEQHIQQSKAEVELLMQSVFSKVFGTENQAIESKTDQPQLSEKETLIPTATIQTVYERKILNMELLEILHQQGGKIAAVNLWKMSKYQKDIDAFYEALKREVEEKKTIKESSEKGWLELIEL